MTKPLYKWALVFCLLVPLKAWNNDTLVIDFEDLLGHNKPEKDQSFVNLKAPYAFRTDAFLREEVALAFIKMADKAQKEGIQLVVISATRNWKYQKRIWESKWNQLNGSDLERARQIMYYSSMPGTSRHHWGTDFDLNNLEPLWWEKTEGQRIYSWLQHNAHEFGFFQPFSDQNKTRLSGYKEEKWHWSYAPLSIPIKRAYNQLVTYNDIQGFEGAHLAQELDVINLFVNGIEIHEKLSQ